MQQSLQLAWGPNYIIYYVPPPHSASAVFAPVAEWKSTTGASCNWWQPPPVQVECLHQLTHHTNLALTQVAVIAASCCVGHICIVGGGGGCSCMLLLHHIPTSADAGPDLCTLCPDLCTLHPDLWTLCLLRFPSFNWCKHSTSAGGAFSFSH